MQQIKKDSRLWVWKIMDWHDTGWTDKHTHTHGMYRTKNWYQSVPKIMTLISYLQNKADTDSISNFNYCWNNSRPELFGKKKSEQIIKLVQNSLEVTLLDTHGILMGFEWTRGWCGRFPSILNIRLFFQSYGQGLNLMKLLGA